MIGPDTEHNIDDDDAADFLVLFGPLVVIDEEQKWAVPVVKECPRQLPDFKHIKFASVDDIDFDEADTFRTRLIESYRKSFRNVYTTDSEEAFAEAIAVHFPSEETRMALSRFRAMTTGAGSA